MKKWKVDEKGKLWVYIDGWREAERRECWYCGKEFPHPIHYTGNRTRGRFCSLGCNAKWQAKRRRTKRTVKRCVICLRFYKVQPAKAHRYKTCGDPDCVLKLRSELSKEYQRKQRELR